MPGNAIGLVACCFVIAIVFAIAAGGIEASAGESAEGTLVEGTIVDVDLGYGNLQTDISASAMDIELGDTFTFSCNHTSFPATWASWYEDVAEGEWLGLAGETDQVQIAVSFGHADEISGCKVGDPVSLKLIAPTE